MASSAPSARTGADTRRALGEVVWLVGSARTALAGGDAERALRVAGALVAACDRLTVRGLAPAALSGEARAATALLERGATALADHALVRAGDAARRARFGVPSPPGSRAV